MRESGFHDFSKVNLRRILTENGNPIRNIGLKKCGKMEYLSFRGVYIDSSIVAYQGAEIFPGNFSAIRGILSRVLLLET